MAEEKRIRIKIDGFGDDDFVVQSFRGSERISTLFRYSIVLASGQLVHNFDDLLKAKAHLIFGDPELHVHGMLCSVQQGYDSALAQHTGLKTTLEVVLVPTVWKLSMHSRTRIYRDKTAMDVVKEVIGAGDPSMKITPKVSGDHPKQEFWLQYQETDLDFIQRICEHEGIHYHFIHGDGEEEMVFGDSNSAFEQIDEPDIRLGQSRAVAGANLSLSSPDQTITKFGSRQKFIPKKVILQDYNYETPAANLKVENEAAQDPAEGEQYEYGENYADTNEGKALMKIRGQEILAGRRVFTGQGIVRRFYAGARFKLTDADRIDTSLAEEYLLTDVSRDGSQSVAQSRQSSDRFVNDFTCILNSVVYRPERRTPCPRIAGLLHAKVVASDDGEYADVDEHGRYHVHFAFDLDDRGSIPVRLMEPYVGNKYGTHWPLHKDVEVLVGFENGDPDRPIIVAAAFNTDHPSPVKGENHSQSINRTAAENEIVYEDTKDKEFIWMRSPGHETSLSLGKGHSQRAETPDGVAMATQGNVFINAGHAIHIGAGDSTCSDGSGGIRKIIQENEVWLASIGAILATATGIGLEYKSNAISGAVVADLAGLAGGLVGSYLSHTNVYISSPTKVAAMAGAEVFVGAGAALDCAAAGAASFVAGMEATIGGVKSTAVLSGGPVEIVSIGKNIILHAKKKDIKIEAHDNIKLEAEKEIIDVIAKEKDIQMKCKKDFIIKTEEGHLQVTIQDAIDMTSQDAKQITIRAGESSIVMKDAEMVLKCGDAKITLKKSGDIEFKGAKVETKASGRITLQSDQMVKLKGSLVDVQEGAMKAS